MLDTIIVLYFYHPHSYTRDLQFHFYYLKTTHLITKQNTQQITKTLYTTRLLFTILLSDTLTHLSLNSRWQLVCIPMYTPPVIQTHCEVRLECHYYMLYYIGVYLVFDGYA